MGKGPHNLNEETFVSEKEEGEVLAEECSGLSQRISSEQSLYFTVFFSVVIFVIDEGFSLCDGEGYGHPNRLLFKGL